MTFAASSMKEVDRTGQGPSLRDMDEIPERPGRPLRQPELAGLWSPRTKVVLERRLWLAVLRAQAELGVDVPAGAIEAYEAVIDQVDLDSIEARERVTRHDVKARIEEFSALAGHEHIHKGMTSRDLTENVEQLQVRDSLVLVRGRMVAALARLARLAAEHADLVIVGRSHNVAAQATTLGKRFASCAEELLLALDRLDDLLARYPFRGIKGPMGTAAGPARPPRRRPGEARAAGGRRRPAPRLRPGARLGRAGLPAQPRPRRRRRPRPGGRRPVEPRHHSGSWPATSWSPRGSGRARSAARPCRTR